MRLQESRPLEDPAALAAVTSNPRRELTLEIEHDRQRVLAVAVLDSLPCRDDASGQTHPRPRGRVATGGESSLGLPRAVARCRRTRVGRGARACPKGRILAGGSARLTNTDSRSTLGRPNGKCRRGTVSSSCFLRLSRRSASSLSSLASTSSTPKGIQPPDRQSRTSSSSASRGSGQPSGRGRPATGASTIADSWDRSTCTHEGTAHPGRGGPRQRETPALGGRPRHVFPDARKASRPRSAAPTLPLDRDDHDQPLRRPRPEGRWNHFAAGGSRVVRPKGRNHALWNHPKHAPKGWFQLVPKSREPPEWRYGYLSRGSPSWGARISTGDPLSPRLVPRSSVECRREVRSGMATAIKVASRNLDPHGSVRPFRSVWALIGHGVLTQTPGSFGTPIGSSIGGPQALLSASPTLASRESSSASACSLRRRIAPSTHS